MRESILERNLTVVNSVKKVSAIRLRTTDIGGNILERLGLRVIFVQRDLLKRRDGGRIC